MSGAFQHSPRLEFSLYSFQIALEEHEVHYPAIEEALRDNPQQNPQALMLKDIRHDAHAGIDDEEDERVEEYLQGVA